MNYHAIAAHACGAWGWGTYSWLDKAITAGGGALGAVAVLL